MHHPYSAWADLLPKFQGATPWIQALWLVLVAAVALGVVWCVTDVAKHALAAFRKREPRGRLVYGLVEDEDGRWLVYADGTVRAVEAGEILDEVIGPPATVEQLRSTQVPTAVLPLGV
jgi:hypothetical protein